jgi:ankyrin repeat protein
MASAPTTRRKVIVAAALVAAVVVGGAASCRLARPVLDSRLHVAVRAGEVDRARLLLALGADVDAKGPGGLTPLELAATHRHQDMAELLIARGAGWSIHAAASLGNIGKIHELLAGGADLNARDCWGNTPLHYAAARGADGIAELLLMRGASVNVRNNWGGTPLHMTAGTGVAELLLAHGADPNIADMHGRTPLHRHWADRDVVELLVEKGADVNAVDSDGKTALQLAEENGHTDLAALLRQHGAER